MDITRVTVCDKHMFYTPIAAGETCDTHGDYMIPANRWEVTYPDTNGNGEAFLRMAYRSNGDHAVFTSYRAAYYFATGK